MLKSPQTRKRHTGLHVCTHELKSLRSAELRDHLFSFFFFPCTSGLPARIREKAALPPLNVSWCLPGCLFWEEIKGEPLPPAPTKGGSRQRGVGRGERGEGRAKGEGREADEWVSAKAGLMGAWIDGFSDGCSGGGIQARVSAGSRLIRHAYVLLPRGYEQSAVISRITANRFCYRSHWFDYENPGRQAAKCRVEQ